MSEQTEQQAPDMMKLWRDWLTQSERQWNSFLNDVVGSETIARSMGGQMEAFAAFQRMTSDGMERYLSFMNMPSRKDIIGLGETLRAMEGRLARIEEMFQIAVESVDGTSAPSSQEEPARTRQPDGVPVDEETQQEAAIPEELRR